jgi:hypothetical protein
LVFFLDFLLYFLPPEVEGGGGGIGINSNIGVSFSSIVHSKTPCSRFSSIK